MMPLKKAKEWGIRSGHPQSIGQISNGKYELLKETGGIE